LARGKKRALIAIVSILTCGGMLSCACGEEVKTNAPPVPFVWATSNYTDKVFKTITDGSQLADPSLKGKVIKYKPLGGLGRPISFGQISIIQSSGCCLIFSSQNASAFRAAGNRRSKQLKEQPNCFYIYIPDDRLNEEMYADIKKAAGWEAYSRDQIGRIGVILGTKIKTGMSGSSYDW